MRRRRRRIGREREGEDVGDHENITLVEKTQGDLISMLIFPPYRNPPPSPPPPPACALLPSYKDQCMRLPLFSSGGSPASFLASTFAASRLAGYPGFNLTDHTERTTTRAIFVRATGNRIRRILATSEHSLRELSIWERRAREEDITGGLADE